MPETFSFFENTVNIGAIQSNNEYIYRPKHGWSSSSEEGNGMVNFGVDIQQETVKYNIISENENSSLTLAGPSIGADVGLKASLKNPGLSAMVKLSAARVEGKVIVSESFSLYGCVGFNVNTGIRIGLDGFEVNCLGNGLTVGYGGKFTVNTLFGSAGTTPPEHKPSSPSNSRVNQINSIKCDRSTRAIRKDGNVYSFAN